MLFNGRGIIDQASLQRVLADKQIDLDSREMLEIVNGEKQLSNQDLIFYVTIQKDHNEEETKNKYASLTNIDFSETKS